MELPRKLPADALGLGLRLPHYPYLFEHWPEVGYFEVISENFLGDSQGPRDKLDRVRGRYPIVLHGVGLNLLGHAPLDEDYLDDLCRLADYVDAPFVSDHLCWTGAHGVSHHDLLPTPYTADLVGFAAERAHEVQERLGRPFGLENLSSYVEFKSSTMTEWEFYTAVVREAGCSFMLDVNNIYVSSVNHGFDPEAYLAAIDFSRVLQVHLAGYSREPNGTIVDTHDHPVSDAVWALYRQAWQMGGPFRIDVELCAKCGGRLKMRALVITVASIRRYLRWLGDPTEPPVLAPARDPPFFKSVAIRRRLGEPVQAELFDAH